MNVFRNKEALKSLAGSLTLAIGATVAAFLWNPGFGIFTLVTGCGFLLIQYWNLRERYRKISDLAADVDKILHGKDKIALDQYAEGELGILQSEVYKMTVRLREQRQRLQDDKVFLADSIADISHQIRTPLTSINLMVSLLSERDITDERRLKLTRELYELLSRIDWLITTLLKMSKLDAGTIRLKAENISLEELIRTATGPLLVPIELREQTLEIVAEGDFNGDISWTCEAIANIVKNCMEHTPAGGKLNIRALDNALYTEIVISDNGSGISKEDLPHIFERFYKGGNSDDKSFGIGLALARTIITTQDGTIKAENIAPHGAKFTIRFYKGTV